MKEIYDLGYQNVKDFSFLVTVVKRLDAVLVDVRYSPKSRNPTWSGSNLKKVFGERYVHIPELGNVNYKSNHAIELFDKDKGLKILEGILTQKNVIIMCACWDRKSCHRKVVSRYLELRNNIEAIDLTYDLMKIISGIEEDPEPVQNSLF